MILAFLAFAVPLILALLVLGAMSASTYGDIWPTQGADTNGGFFDPSVLTLTDLAATVANTSAPVVTSASYNFVSNDNNHWVYVKSGTHWQAGWFQIASTAANAATLNAAPGTWYDSNGRLGTTTGCTSDGTATLSAGTWSVDYSHAAAAVIAVTDAVTSTSTTVTSASANFRASMVGNVLFGSGAGWGTNNQRYVITVVTNATTITIERTSGATGSGQTVNIGGALATPVEGWAATAGTKGAPASATVFIKGNVGNAPGLTAALAFPQGALNTPTRFIGYNLIPGDLDKANQFPTQGGFTWTNFPQITTSGASGHGLLGPAASANVVFRNLILDGAGATPATTAISSTGDWFLDNALVKNFNGGASSTINMNDGCTARRCEITANTTTGTAGAVKGAGQSGASNFLVDSFVHDNTGIGITEQISGGNSSFHMKRCIVSKNTGASSDGYQYNASGGGGSIFLVENCIFYKNGRDAIRMPVAAGQPTGLSISNSIFYGNTGQTLNNTGSAMNDQTGVDYNAYDTAYVGLPQGIHDVKLGADPFINGAGNDFRLNGTANGGTLCKGTGSTPNLDIGALQGGLACGEEGGMVTVIRDNWGGWW